MTRLVVLQQQEEQQVLVVSFMHLEVAQFRQSEEIQHLFADMLVLPAQILEEFAFMVQAEVAQADLLLPPILRTLGRLVARVLRLERV
jgi:hypothetical protein